MSSQMTSAEVANKTIEISAGDYTLKAGTSKVTFDGFLKVYNDADEEEQKDEAKIPDLEQGDKVKCQKVEPKQHFTQPPPRYNEASLVKALEEHGIGRPSTYATIITVIQTRKYVEKKIRHFVRHFWVELFQNSCVRNSLILWIQIYGRHGNKT